MAETLKDLLIDKASVKKACITWLISSGVGFYMIRYHAFTHEHFPKGIPSLNLSSGWNEFCIYTCGFGLLALLLMLIYDYKESGFSGLGFVCAFITTLFSMALTTFLICG